MPALPLSDQAGNSLVAFHVVAEEELPYMSEEVPLPAALAVVVHAHSVLMMFDSRRAQWELPGGMREPGETPRAAAIRELHEETGISGVELTFAAVAEFFLVKPDRRELLAVYRGRLQTLPHLTPNDEALAFRWWSPHEPVSDDMSPLDAEIARRVHESRHHEP
jgi:8-oxo-dGTP pyrophosphatase MutT (NUDIX family)